MEVTTQQRPLLLLKCYNFLMAVYLYVLQCTIETRDEIYLRKVTHAASFSKKMFLWN